jgi:hypothetical protein
MAPSFDATYSIDREVITWQGVDITQAIAEGDGSITETLEGASGWSQKGNGVGGAVQSFNPSTRGTIKIKVSMEHPVHTQLKALVRVDQLTRAIAAPMTRLRNSGEVITYENARVTRVPDEGGGSTAGESEWEWIFTRKVSNAGVLLNVI